MWLMWMFAVVIPLGVIHAIVTGEISTGRYTTSMLRFEEKPIGFIVLIAALCLLELFLVSVLLRSRRDEQAAGTKRGRRRRPRATDHR